MRIVGVLCVLSGHACSRRKMWIWVWVYILISHIHCGSSSEVLEDGVYGTRVFEAKHGLLGFVGALGWLAFAISEKGLVRMRARK